MVGEIPKTLNEAKTKYIHLVEYLSQLPAGLGEPEYIMKLDRSMGGMESPNLIYPVEGPLFVHIYQLPGEAAQYVAIEPNLQDKDNKLYDQILDSMIEMAETLPVPNNLEEVGKILEDTFDKLVSVKTSSLSYFKKSKIMLTPRQYDTIKYFILRNRVGYGKLEILFKDPWLEDIHCTGVGKLSTIHKIFSTVEVSIEFKDDLELNKYILEVSERVERPVSDSHSIVDAMMPDGSRVNFIYGRDISLEGSSFTIRKFSGVPISVTQLINWGTMSSQLAAYLWICLEHGMNLFVCGETASGKTTTLNAIATFIKPDDKVFTVENTPEVTMPHNTWQHLLTREAGKNTDITLQSLLIAALRSRPDYIIVGEIRGEEGNIAFQAMQTGHPVMSTFHAGSPKSMIQRITGQPINVPITFVDNLNLCLIQQAVKRNGKNIRRVMSLTELERYYEPEKKMVTREVFEWEPSNDIHEFKGMFNSYLLERKIAHILGYKNPRDIYKDMEFRQHILERMVEEKIFNYYEVWDIIKKFSRSGTKALPFKV